MSWSFTLAVGPHWSALQSPRGVSRAVGQVNALVLLCLSSIILSPLNGNVKMSPHETGDIHVESEGTATSDRHFAMRAREPDMRQSRGAARPIAPACQTAQSALSARQRSGSG